MSHTFGQIQPKVRDMGMGLVAQRSRLTESSRVNHRPRSPAGQPLLDPGGHHTLAVSMRQQIVGSAGKICMEGDICLYI